MAKLASTDIYGELKVSGKTKLKKDLDVVGKVTLNEGNEELATKTYVDNVKQASKTEFDEHLADYATLDKAGHVKAETDEDGKLILDIPKSNYNADRIPSVNDDATQGYSVGSMWHFNEPTGTARIYVCSKDTINSAEWILYASSDNADIPYYSEGIEYIPFEQGVHKYPSNMNSWTEKREDGLYIFSEDIGQTVVFSHQIGFSSSEQINVSTLRTVNVEIESNSGGDSGIQFGVSNDKYTADSYISSVSERDSLQNVDTKIYSADVSTLNGYYYIKLAMRPEVKGKDYQWKIKRIWGEK